jgi:hypothetical protein
MLYDIGFTFIDRIRQKSKNNISLESVIDGIILAPIPNKNLLSSASANAKLDPPTNPLPELEVRTNIPSDVTFGPVVKIQSQSVNGLLRWLATPPAKRDNERVFTLKVDKP